MGVYFAHIDNAFYGENWYAKMVNGGQWDKSAAEKSALHQCPITYHIDSLGRCLEESSIHRSKTITTRYRYDTRGHEAQKYDPLGRLVEVQMHDLRGKVINRKSMDSGSKSCFFNMAGNPFLTWNSRGIVSHSAYDALHRETKTWMKRAGQSRVLAVEISYGDEKEHEACAVQHNLRQKVVRTCNQAGIYSNTSLDFKGNCTSTSLRLCSDYKEVVDWSTGPPLQELAYKSEASLDAHNRRKEFKDAYENCTRQAFDRLGRLTLLEHARKSALQSWTTYLSNQTYTAGDEELATQYGNGVRTERGYDDFSRNVLREKTFKPKLGLLEDFSHAYDCLGHKTHTIDQSEQAVFFQNEVVTTERDFTYDSLGQLVAATAREKFDASHGGDRQLQSYNAHSSSSPGILSGDGKQMCRYIETYRYDDAGNISSLRHEPASRAKLTGRTRYYNYQEPSCLEGTIEKPIYGNRLTRTKIGKAEEVYHYDDENAGRYGYDGDAGIAGCMMSMLGYTSMTWDLNGQLRSSTPGKLKEGVADTTWYVYDSHGNRVRKVAEGAVPNGSVGQKLRETIYLTDMDVYCTYAGANPKATSHVITSHIADVARIALIEQDLSVDGSSPLIRYQISDGLEVDDHGQLISHEEYSPFEATTYIACGRQIKAPSRYRYAAYLRDHETGLFYCEMRYYAPWLGRWTSPDPIDTEDDLNVYCYVSNDFIMYEDSTGTMKNIPGKPKPIEMKITQVKIKKKHRSVSTGGENQASRMEPVRFKINLQSLLSYTPEPTDKTYGLKLQRPPKMVLVN